MPRFTPSSQLRVPAQRYFFREWRKFRGHTQAELAELVGVATPTINQIENGKVGFTRQSLEAIAAALHCHPGDLLMRRPSNEPSLLEIWDRVPETSKPQALAILKTFVADPGTTN